MGGDSNLTFDFMLAVMIITMIVVGIIGGMSAEKLADAFAKGLVSMAFVAFVIGLAKVISLVLADGNVIHTIVYVLTKPLMSLPKSVSSVGLTLIVSVINPLIPSAMIGSCIMAEVPFPRWFKWVFPKVITLILLACVIVFLLTVTGWTGVI